MTNNSKLKLLITCIASWSILLLGSSPLKAWGWEHSGIVYMAGKNLSGNARETIERYLDKPIVEYAGWLDDVRREKIPEYEETRWWHMLSVDMDGKVSRTPIRENGDGYALGQLENAIRALKD